MDGFITSEVVFIERPAAAIIMQPSELMMEQSAKRPPEKVLTMPTTSSTKNQPAPARSPNSKKPARGRSSLLSIISGDDKKTSKTSLGSISDDQPLPPTGSSSSQADSISVASPTAILEMDVFAPCSETVTSPTTSVVSSKSESESSELNSKGAQDNVSKSAAESAKEAASENPPKRASVKKPPPPTLAKTYKSKPPATAAKPAKRLSSQTSQSAVSSDTTLTSPVHSEDVFIDISTKTPSTDAENSPERYRNLAKASIAIEPTLSEVGSPADSSVKVTDTQVLPEPAPEPTAEPALESVPEFVLESVLEPVLESVPEPVLESVPEPVLESVPEPVLEYVPEPVLEYVPEPVLESVPEPAPVIEEILTSTSLHTVECEVHLPPPLLEELPPPLPSNLELPLPSIAPANVSYEVEASEDIDDMEFPPPPPEVDFAENPEPTLENYSEKGNFQIQEAIDKIASKYETSSIAISGNKQIRDENQDTFIDPSLSTKEFNSDSIKIPIRDSDHSEKVIGGDNDTATLTNNGRQTMDAVDNVSVVSQTHVGLVHTQDTANLHSKNPVRNEEGVPDISSPLSDRSSGHESVVSEDDEDITHLLTPPKLPKTSSFSALGMDSSVPQSQPVNSDKLEPCPSSTITVMEENNGQALTVVESLEESHSANPPSSTAAHSPPFNTSSESGDSGIETNTYNIIGETVPVTLRPTTNNNRKPDNSVPMFEKYNGDLKRVTFREASNQITPAATSRRSAAEEEKIKRTGLSEDDISQAELFYKGHKTEVMVCPCLATLYFAESASGSSVPVDDWKPEHIGIPVLIYDTGDGKRSRGLTMVFAEKGTGFLLWKSVINYESRWEVVEPVFHRLRISGTADKLAGIAFQDQGSAESFYEYFKACIADPEKNVLNNPNIRNKKKKEKKKSIKHRSAPLPTKSAISMPCQFTHVTQLKQSVDGILALAMIPTEEDGAEDGVE